MRLLGGGYMSAPRPALDFLVCVYCGHSWRPGRVEDCPICRVTKQEDHHGAHTVCPSCFLILRRVRERTKLTDEEEAHLARAPLLRQKLALESEHSLPRRPPAAKRPTTPPEEAHAGQDSERQDETPSEGGS